MSEGTDLLRSGLTYSPSIRSTSSISYTRLLRFKVSKCARMPEIAQNWLQSIVSTEQPGPVRQSYFLQVHIFFASRACFQHNSACGDVYDVYLCIICAFMGCKLFISRCKREGS